MEPVNYDGNSVENLLTFIQGHGGVGNGELPPCVGRPRYAQGPQYHCPVYEAISQLSRDTAFVALADALRRNTGMMNFDFKVNEQSQPIEYVAAEYAICPASFTLRAASPTEVAVQSGGSEIQVMTFKILNAPNQPPHKYSIAIECDHWLTAVKINLLMCNIFKLPVDTNAHLSANLILKLEDEEQFIDVMEFLFKPHAPDEESIVGPLEELLKNVLQSSNDVSLQSKGRDLHAKRIKTNYEINFDENLTSEQKRVLLQGIRGVQRLNGWLDTDLTIASRRLNEANNKIISVVNRKSGEGDLLGYAIIVPENNGLKTWRISQILVRPSLKKGHGIDALIMQKVFEEAINNKVRCITLETEGNDQKKLDFYATVAEGPISVKAENNGHYKSSGVPKIRFNYTW